MESVAEKLRLTQMPINETIESIALSSEVAKKWMEGKEVVKVIVVPGRMVNIVLR